MVRWTLVKTTRNRIYPVGLPLVNNKIKHIGFWHWYFEWRYPDSHSRSLDVDGTRSSYIVKYNVLMYHSIIIKCPSVSSTTCKQTYLCDTGRIWYDSRINDHTKRSQPCFLLKYRKKTCVIITRVFWVPNLFLFNLSLNARFIIFLYGTQVAFNRYSCHHFARRTED